MTHVTSLFVLDYDAPIVQFQVDFLSTTLTIPASMATPLNSGFFPNSQGFNVINSLLAEVTEFMIKIHSFVINASDL